MQLGRKIRDLRLRRGLTVQQLAELTGLSKGFVSQVENNRTSPSLATLQALSAALNVPVTAFFRKFEEQRDATYVKARRDHRIVSVAVIVAVGVNSDGRREVLGMTVGHSEAEPFWVEFLRSLTRRGLRGGKLVTSDAHEGLKAAIVKILGATWQRCRVHFMRNALAHAGRSGRRVVSAFIATAFAQDDAKQAKAQWRRVADQLRLKVPKLATLMDKAETDVLAYMSFPPQHRTKLHSTNPLERLNGEIKRRTEVVGIFPNDASIVRLVGALLLEQQEEWQLDGRRVFSELSMAKLDNTSDQLQDQPTAALAAAA